MTHPKNSEYQKKYRDKNPILSRERCRLYAQAYRSNHPDKYKERNRLQAMKTYNWKKIINEFCSIDLIIFQ